MPLIPGWQGLILPNGKFGSPSERANQMSPEQERRQESDCQKRASNIHAVLPTDLCFTRVLPADGRHCRGKLPSFLASILSASCWPTLRYHLHWGSCTVEKAYMVWFGITAGGPHCCLFSGILWESSESCLLWSACRVRHPNPWKPGHQHSPGGREVL